MWIDILSVSDLRRANLPASATAEQIRAYHLNPARDMQSTDVSCGTLTNASAAFKTAIGRHSWGEQAFYIIDMMNCKEATKHPVGPDDFDTDLELDAFEALTTNLRYGGEGAAYEWHSAEFQWFIDVGLQLSVDWTIPPDIGGGVVTWDARRHHEVISWALGVPKEWAIACAADRAHFSPDPLAGLDHVGGFRCMLANKTPSRRHQDAVDAVYMQLYDTTKNAVVTVDHRRRGYHIHPKVQHLSLSLLVII